MVGQRDRDDPVLAEYLTKRMTQLLAESGPRRARADEVRSRAPSAIAPTTALDPPDLLPSDDPGDDLPARGRPAPADRLAARSEDSVDTLDDWIDFTPVRRFRRVHLVVVAALLVVGLMFAGWSTLRARPVAIASTPSVTPAVPTTAPAPGSTGTPSAKPTTVIMVHVLGAVKKAGVVSLPDRARVRDALQAAGGLKADADPGELNLAQVLADGQQVVVGTVKHPSGQVREGPDMTDVTGSDGGASGSGSSAGTAQTSPVDLNRATVAQLEELPGVGPVTAAKIVAWRDEHSRFSRVEELQEIDGIGPKTYAQLAPHVRV